MQMWQQRAQSQVAAARGSEEDGRHRAVRCSNEAVCRGPAPAGRERDTAARVRRPRTDRMLRAWNAPRLSSCWHSFRTIGSLLTRRDALPRCGPRADVEGVSPVPVQMWAGVSPVPLQMWEG